MITVVMNERGLDLQSAVDFVGDMCKSAIDRFKTERANLPSRGPEIDRQVNTYVQGLADWIVGSLHWSFESTRYFGIDGHKIKKTRVVELLPLRPEAQVSIFGTLGFHINPIQARAMSISFRPPQIKIPASVPSSNIPTPTESEPQTPSDVHSSTATPKPLSDEVFSHLPLPATESIIDIIANPASHAPIQTLDRIQSESLLRMAIPKSATASANGASVQPEILSPTIRDQRLVKNGLAQPFSLCSLTLWVFYTLVYQPILALLRVFLNHDVYAHPFCHYKYM